MSKKLTARNVEKSLRSVSTPERAKANEWFFKTGKGQYGYGDKFIGVSVPNQRAIVKQFRDLDLSELKILLHSPFHECRLTSLFILVHQYEQGDSKTKATLTKFYLSNLKYVNNWDLVDSSAHKILGEELINKNREILYKLAKSESMWSRRVAIISTFTFLKDNDFKDALKLAEIYLDDDQDLMHKATGWTLREIGKKSRPTLLKFLDKHHKKMPRTALRYSIEHLSLDLKKKYMAK